MASHTQFPSEICVGDITYGFQANYDNGDWSKALLYRNCPLVIQINNARMLFGVLEYTNPPGQKNDFHKYSTAICVDQEDAEIQSLKTLIDYIEGTVQQDMPDETDTQFVSCIKSSKHKENHLRIKLPVYKGRMNFDIYYNGDKINMSMESLKKELVHNRKANLLLELGPVWCSGKKTGISWKMIAVQFESARFRAYSK